MQQRRPRAPRRREDGGWMERPPAAVGFTSNRVVMPQMCLLEMGTCSLTVYFLCSFREALATEGLRRPCHQWPLSAISMFLSLSHQGTWVQKRPFRSQGDMITKRAFKNLLSQFLRNPFIHFQQIFSKCQLGARHCTRLTGQTCDQETPCLWNEEEVTF